MNYLQLPIQDNLESALLNLSTQIIRPKSSILALSRTVSHTCNIGVTTFPTEGGLSYYVSLALAFCMSGALRTSSCAIQLDHQSPVSLLRATTGSSPSPCLVLG